MALIIFIYFNLSCPFLFSHQNLKIQKSKKTNFFWFQNDDAKMRNNIQNDIIINWSLSSSSSLSLAVYRNQFTFFLRFALFSFDHWFADIFCFWFADKWSLMKISFWFDFYLTLPFFLFIDWLSDELIIKIPDLRKKHKDYFDEITWFLIAMMMFSSFGFRQQQMIENSKKPKTAKNQNPLPRYHPNNKKHFNCFYVTIIKKKSCPENWRQCFACTTWHGYHNQTKQTNKPPQNKTTK